jgi:hypothetical protein
MDSLLRGNALLPLGAKPRILAFGELIPGRRSLHPTDKDLSAGTPILGVAST